ncbi:MAG: hypothetical protein E6X21_16355 [Clostridium sp.]|uniref:hypothetical protein n=1 Tax=Clostridium sp. TaxID=1506 RepID=UPI002913C425|nr:hypothetical protein [Clostridium sp.]
MASHSKDIHWCICGCRATEEHHIVFRSQCKALENCEINKIYLCFNCHRGDVGVHGKNGHYLDSRLKLKFQNRLEIMLNKQQVTKEEINEVLKISDKALYTLLKTLKVDKGKYDREDVIRACMGGKMVIERYK